MEEGGRSGLALMVRTVFGSPDDARRVPSWSYRRVILEGIEVRLWLLWDVKPVGFVVRFEFCERSGACWSIRGRCGR